MVEGVWEGPETLIPSTHFFPFSELMFMKTKEKVLTDLDPAPGGDVERPRVLMSSVHLEISIESAPGPCLGQSITH